MSEFDRAALILKMAMADAEFDRRPFDGLGRADKDRYLARSLAALLIAENGIRPDEARECARIVGDVWPRGGAHTYASENADRYIALEDASESLRATLLRRALGFASASSSA